MTPVSEARPEPLPGVGGRGAPVPPAAPGTIPFTRLDNADPYLLEELMVAVERVAAAGGFTMGEELDGFEAEFAAWCEARECIGVSSGTEALALAFRALGLGAGDEVIVPANSFVATAEAVTLCGARPRLVDVAPESGLLTAEIVERNLNPHVRAVVPVHLYGRTVDMDPLVGVARRAGIAVVEDACQAHGARYRGRRVGTLGDLGCFSFYPTKNLGAWGDGGAVVTGDRGLAERVRLLRSHGEGSARHSHRVAGTTARLHSLQAAILRVKLRHLERWNAERRAAGAALSAALEGCSEIELPARVGLGSDHVFHLFVIRTRGRDRMRAGLADEGVASAIHYPHPIHLTEAYAHLGMCAGDLPVAERLAARILSLPVFPGMTELDVQRVARAVRSIAETRVSAAVS